MRWIASTPFPLVVLDPSDSEKCGFVKECFAKQYLKIAGRWEDHVLTALTNRSFDD